MERETNASMAGEVRKRLAMICEQCPQVADEVIDLDRGLRRECSPGSCAKALFRVVEAGREMFAREITELFHLFGSELEVEARNEVDAPLERWGFKPDPDDDLESYCQRMIDRVLMDRDYGSRSVILRFCYS